MTGNQPSFMSGSKDFCNWSNHYKVLYILMKPIIEKLFVESAVGIADIGIGEALYQKNNINDAYINITKGIGEAQRNGIADTLFVGYGICAQIEFARGNIEECNKILENIKETINIHKAHHLIPNYNALCTRFYIKERKIDKTRKWIEEVDVDIKSKFNSLDRYQYLTQIRAYILLENYKEALLTLDIMFPYIETFNRTFYKIEYYILKAITLNKLNAKNEDVYKNIEQALLIAQKYNFVRVFVDETYELSQILKEYKKIKNKKVKVTYINIVLKEINNFYNIHYKNHRKVSLTKAEFEVMKLIEKGLTNNEIAEKLSVSIATIKTHINHIYSKLDVKNRTKAINKFKNM